MENYRKLTDERLALLAQEGDDEAFTTLFLRYDRYMESQAKKATLRFPSFNEEEFFSFFQEKFMQMVLRFDVSRGVFFTLYFSLIAPKWVANYVREKLQKRVRDEHGRKINVDEPSNYDKYKQKPTDFTNNKNKNIITDNRFTYEYQQDSTDTELYEYLASVDGNNAKIIQLLVRGYTYEQIAVAMGRQGSRPTLIQWTYRAINRIKEATIDYYKQADCADEISSYIN